MKRNVFFIAFGLVIMIVGGAAISKNLNKKQDFQKFKEGFDKYNLPFSISDKDTFKVSNNTLLHSDTTKTRLELGYWGSEIYGSYKEFIPELKVSSFSREVTSNCAYVANLYQNTNFTALCYLVSNGFYDSLGEKHFIIATYNNVSGNRIDKLEFAGQTTPEKYTDGLFAKDNTVTVSSYTKKFKNDPKTTGYDNNSVVARELTGSTSYKLDENGHFGKIDATTVSVK